MWLRIENSKSYLSSSPFPSFVASAKPKPLIMASSSNCRRSTTTLEEEAADATEFSKLVLQEIGFVRKSFEAVKIKASRKIEDADEAQKQFDELMVLPEGRAEERDYKLRQLKMKVSKLRMEIPFKLIAPEEQPHPNIVRWRRQESDLYGHKEISRSKPDIDDNNRDTPVPYQEIESILGGTPFWLREILPCFVFFPKNAVINRGVFFSLLPSLTEEGLGALVERRLVQAVYKKSNLLSVDGYRMYPCVHSYLRSEASGFNKEWPNMYVGRCHDVEEKFIYHTVQEFQRLNNNHTAPMKDVLHLGKWNNSANQHIEIIDPELFFKHMSKYTGLKSVSLRGISMIQKLPEFITNLRKLQHLDLRACHNLEVIPSSIANLKNSLLYLDISDCYFLDHMPKALASLDQLRVLKGFVVGENKHGQSCSLEDLRHFYYLRKLNIYTSIKRFPTNGQLQTLECFRGLSSLTISWGGCSSTQGNEDECEWLEELTDVCHIFNLKKLDLQCVPETVTRHWLKPINFGNLKKLYIRGGNFSDLGQSPWDGRRWEVKTLRLKHLCKLNMDWGELNRLFPKLICVEKVDCPNLHRFPCNDSGIWMKNQKV